MDRPSACGLALSTHSLFEPHMNVLKALCVIAISTAFVIHAHAAEPLRVMAFNIRYDNPGDGPNNWKHRRDAVAKLIKERELDVAGLQEVMAHQLDDLKERLPDYEFLGVGRDDGKRQGEFSPLLVKKDSFKIEDSGTFWLS